MRHQPYNHQEAKTERKKSHEWRWRIAALALFLLARAATARADGVPFTISGTDADTHGDSFTFNFFGDITPGPLPAELTVTWGGKLFEIGTLCPGGCTTNFSNNIGGFPEFGTGILWQWGDSTCTEFGSQGQCLNTVFQYNLEVNRNGAEIVTPVITPEPASLVLLAVAGLAFLAKYKLGIKAA